MKHPAILRVFLHTQSFIPYFQVKVVTCKYNTTSGSTCLTKKKTLQAQKKDKQLN